MQIVTTDPDVVRLPTGSYAGPPQQSIRVPIKEDVSVMRFLHHGCSRFRVLRSAGVGLLLAWAVVGCADLARYAAADPPRITLAGIRILDLNLFEQRFLLALRVQNPNRFQLPIEGMSYTLEVNGSEFAHGVDNQKATIPALGEQVLHVSVVSNLLDTLGQLRRWENQPPQQLDYHLRGKIQVADLSVALPFEYSGKVLLQDSRSSDVVE